MNFASLIGNAVDSGRIDDTTVQANLYSQWFNDYDIEMYRSNFGACQSVFISNYSFLGKMTSSFK